MRKLLSAAAIAVSLVLGLAIATSSANAGYHNYVLCWTGVSGASECVDLPRNYRIPGIKKPRIPNDTVSFTLTRHMIACIRGFVDTDGMHPGQEATIYAPKR